MRLRSALTLVVCAAALLPAAVASAATDWAPGSRVPGRITISLRAGLQPSVAKSAGGIAVDIPALQSLADRFGVNDMSRLFPGPNAPAKAGRPDLSLVWAVDFPESLDLDGVLKAYAALPEVAKAEAVDVCAQYGLPNDSNLDQQWYLRNLTAGGKDVRAVGGWAQAHGDTNVIVAIVDSGVDWRHPDLGGSGPNYRRGAIWTNWAEANGLPGVDDDHNGYIDDTRGWDFVTGVTGEPGEDVSVPDNDPSDWESHGTMCAGIVGGIANNGVGIAGTTWGCKVMPVRVGWLPSGATGGVVRMDFAAQGMVYAANNGAKIINCSWGSVSYLSTAVEYCQSLGVLVVTAAGNDNWETPSFLGSYPGVLAVAATDQNDFKTSFSNYGWWVSLSAPGTGIFSTFFNKVGGTHGYASWDGTSFSSPLTCGAAALVWSAHPGWDCWTVSNQLTATADNINALNPGLAGKLGAGRVNLLRALGDRFLKYPDEFSSLFDAQNEAAPGDTIAFRSTEAVTGPLTIFNKPLYVLGGYNADFTARDPVSAPTPITGNAGGPVLSFNSGTTGATIIDGFRVTGGGGQVFSSPQSGQYGGGIICNGTSPTLRNLDVTGNTVGGSITFGGGGGIVLVNSGALLDNVKVHGNTAVQGAGVYAYLGNPTLRSCRIYDNTLVQDNASYPPRGGGLYVTDGTATLQGCEISGHLDAEAGGGVYAGNYLATTGLVLTGNNIHHNTARVKGGGLYMGGSSITMKRDRLHDNGKATGATFMTGGGFAIENASATLDSVNVRACTAQIGAGGALTGCPTGIVSRSLFVANVADIFGGALAYQGCAAGNLTNNTFVVNSGGIGAGGVYLVSSSPSVANNILAANTGGATFANGLHAQGATPAFACNDAFGNANGNYSGLPDPTGAGGNVAVDPKFCLVTADDYGLQPGSPCLPAGSGGCGLIGALTTSCAIVPVPDGPGLPTLAFRVEPAAPNPFNPLTRIRFTLPAAARTTVRVYDLAGRAVRTLVDGDLAPAAHAVEWNGRDDAGRAVSSGVYFYRVTSGANTFTGRVALVK